MKKIYKTIVFIITLAFNHLIYAQSQPSNCLFCALNGTCYNDTRNNAMAVRAVCYTNHSPYNNKETNYNGSFVNCSFVVNGDYLGTETFKKLVQTGKLVITK